MMDGHGHGHGHGDGRSQSLSRLKRSETELERSGTKRNGVERYETKWNGRSRDGHGMVTGRSRFRLKTKELL